jgi:hypothetical protein
VQITAHSKSFNEFCHTLYKNPRPLSSSPIPCITCIWTDSIFTSYSSSLNSLCLRQSDLLFPPWLHWAPFHLLVFVINFLFWTDSSWPCSYQINFFIERFFLRTYCFFCLF